VVVGSTSYHKSFAFTQCMRSHGEPDWPEPSSTGTFSDSQININSPQYHTAIGACGNLLPPGVQPLQLSAAQLRQRLDQALKFAGCMHAHGLAKYPDPTIQTIENGQNGSLAGTGVPPNSPQFQSALKSCRSLMPGSG
jgi:hypothetical protein